MKLLGIDGCRGAWLAAMGEEKPRALSFLLVQDLAPLFAEAEAGRAVVAIDIPIGLADHDGRLCDGAARKLLGDRAACVFTAPTRAALAGSLYTEACDLNAAACGKRLSQQAYGILPCIAEVDRLIRPELQDRVRECHPEVTFAVLAGHPLREPKKSAAGHAMRLELLAQFGIEPDADRVRNAFGRGKVGADDVLDACAALATAYRIADGAERVLPDGPSQRDRRGCGWRSSLERACSEAGDTMPTTTSVIVNPGWDLLLRHVARCRRSIRVIAPFARSNVLKSILDCCHLPLDRVRLISRADDEAVIHGALDYDAFAHWIRSGAQLRVGDCSLHAKLCVFDGKRAIVTSANLTEAALTNNWELGLLTEDPVVVAQLVALFENLWKQLRPVDEGDVLGWQAELEAALAGAAITRPSGLKDRGSRIEPVSPARPRPSVAGHARRYFLKMYATGATREIPSMRPDANPSYWGGLTFGEAQARPTRLRPGDIVFVCWQVAGERKRVGVRGEVLRSWDRVKDVAPQSLRARFDGIARWPNVLWLRDIEILRGPIIDLVDVDAVVDTLGERTFESSLKNSPGGGPPAARGVFRTSRSHPELTPEAGELFDKLFRAAAARHGSLRLPVGSETWYSGQAPGRFKRT